MKITGLLIIFGPIVAIAAAIGYGCTDNVGAKLSLALGVIGLLIYAFFVYTILNSMNTDI